jgi:hypothetical protein
MYGQVMYGQVMYGQVMYGLLHRQGFLAQDISIPVGIFFSRRDQAI